jgi:hypothetical protein
MNVRKVCYVSCQTGDGIEELMEAIVDLAEKHSFLKQTVPESYHLLLQTIDNLRSGKSPDTASSASPSSPSTSPSPPMTSPKSPKSPKAPKTPKPAKPPVSPVSGTVSLPILPVQDLSETRVAPLYSSESYIAFARESAVQVRSFSAFVLFLNLYSEKLKNKICYVIRRG